jgi:hypothetical protein
VTVYRREFQRQAERQTEWRNALHAERGVWARAQGKQMWRLDETEGPFRVRKKLEPEHVKILLNSRVANEAIRDVEEPDGETQSVVQVEVPPWAEGYEFSTTEVEGALHATLCSSVSDRIIKQMTKNGKMT